MTLYVFDLLVLLHDFFWGKIVGVEKRACERDETHS